MLQTIREKAQSVVALILAGLLSLTFALWGIQYYLEGASSDANTMVKVNGVAIKRNQLNAAYHRLQTDFVAKYGADKLTEKVQHQLRKTALQGLITQQVLVQGAEDSGFEVSLAQAEMVLTHIPAFQEKGEFSPAIFQRVLSTSLFTQRQFLKNLRDSLLVQQVQTGIINSAFALPGETKHAIQLLKEKRDFKYLIIPASRFLNKVEPTKNEVHSYYESHQNEFEVPEQVSISYLVLSPKDAKHASHVTDKALLQYYYDNIDAYSNKQGKAKPFAGVKKEVHAAYLQSKASDRFSKMSDQLSNLTYTNPSSLQAASDELKLPVKTTPLFTHDGLRAGIAKNPQVVSAAFSPDVLQQGNNSNPIELSDGTVIVLRVKQHVAASVKPLPEVRSTIVKMLKVKAAKQDALQLGEDIVAELKKQADPDEIAAKNALEWRTKKDASRESRNLPINIIEAAFSAPAPKGGKPDYAGSSLANGDYTIIGVTKTVSGQSEQLSKQHRDAINKGVENSFGMLDYNLYVHQQMRSAKVKHLHK